jgi:hypothetical protein
MTVDTANEVVANVPKCRICGYSAHYLGDHLSEAHSLSIDDYLSAYPNAPTISREALEAFKAEQTKNLKRSHPPTDLNLYIEMMGFKVPVNPDVDVNDCLPLPPAYRLPKFGKLALDIMEALISIFRGRHVYIYGLPGSGKDALIHAVSSMQRRPALIKQVQPSADIQSWFFYRSFDNQGTAWEEGELLKALRDGYLTKSGRRIPYLILITDFDRATKAQAEALRLVLDSISGRVEGPGGKVYDIFPGTQVIVTANTAGGGDTRGRMTSSNVIDASILDRFERKYEFHWMDWQDEGEIVRAKFPLLMERCPGIFTQVGNATTSLRAAIHQEELYAEFSHRGVCSWLGHCEDIVAITGEVPTDLHRRGARAFLDGLPDVETRKAAERLIDPHIKGGVVDAGVRTGTRTDPLGGFTS